MDEQESILLALGRARRVLVATHSKPDGDAIGSSVAMTLGLRRKGIDSQLLLFDPPPPKYAFLLEDHQIGWKKDVDMQGFDTLLVVDTGTWSQLPGLKDRLVNWTGQKLVIDHHLTQEEWADIKWVDHSASAVGEMIADLMQHWGVKLDAALATPIFLAISTDTGWFQFSNTTPRTMRLAATLMEIGINTERLYRIAFQNERAPRLALMARALQSLELLAGNRVAVMSLAKQDFEQTGATGGDTENIINLPLQVGSVEVSIFLADQPGSDPVRVSLRSKGKIDVAAFAGRFGGGGHARAAGLKIPGDLATARRSVTEAMLAAIS